MIESALYIVATPIGNLEDVSKRAISVLEAATLIAAEDTRHSKIFLNAIGVVGKRMLSCHDHNEEERVELIVKEIEQGGIVALISDAGTPLICDPGFKVVRELVKRGIKVSPIPGPSAVITALSASGLPTDEFVFKGFLPVKDKELTEALALLKNVKSTTVFYESPKRILKTVKFDFLAQDANYTKGEFVVLVGPSEEQEADEVSPKAYEALESLVEFVPAKVACQVVSKLTGISKNALYDKALALKNS